MRLKEYIAWPLLLVGLSVPALMDCSSDLQDVGCSEFATGNIAALGDKSITAGVQAAANLVGLAKTMQETVTTACKDIAVKGGTSATAVTTTGDQGAADWCAKAKAVIDAKLAAAAGATLRVDYTPPVCTVDVQAEANCEAECSGKAECTGSVQASCEAGKLAGTCSGSCTGSCTATATVPSVACSGTCTAECTGTCGGTCKGTCEGTCAVKDADGNCNGTCSGTCKGNCNAKCEGTCAGACEVTQGTASASCGGECKGSCSVEFQAPRCEGKASASCDADVNCKSSCTGHAQAKASCDPAVVKIAATGALAADAEFIKALQTDLGLIYKVTLGQAKLATDALATVTGTVTGMVSAAGKVSVHAGSCVAAAVKGTGDALLSVQASVNVSVSVSASASGSAG